MMTALLCLDPSASRCATIGDVVSGLGLDLTACACEAQALRHLQGPLGFAAMVTADRLEDGDGISLIKCLRLLPHRQALPVAFVMPERNLPLAKAALCAGATEVFVGDEWGALRESIAGWANFTDVQHVDGRVLLVEDSDSQALLVAHLFDVMGLSVDRASTIDEAVALLAERSYRLAVIDIVLEDSKTGVTLLRHMRQRLGLSLPVLMMSAHRDLSRRLSALQAGADDFLDKPFVVEELVWRVRRLLQSVTADTVVEPAAAAGAVANGRSPWQGLSAREAQIGELLVAGRSDKDIAAELNISYWTVRTHVQHIFSKLDVLNRRELIARFSNLAR